MTAASTLFESVKIGFQELKNRIVMAPMTRSPALVWLLPYQEVQKAGITFTTKPRKETRS